MQASTTSTPKADEFRAIDKRLNWSILHRVGQVSVFEDLSGPEPVYMAERSSAAHPDFNGWISGRRLQRALRVVLAESM